MRKSHEPLSEKGDIEAFFAADVASLVSRKLPGYQESELRYLTFLFTCPLTVLHGLETAGTAKGPAEEQQELNIHLVGVRRAELRHLIGWEILACRLPRLRRLRLHFIGDEATVGDFPKEFSYKGRDLQNERPDVEVKYFFPKPELYQDYIRSRGNRPDAIVALDCGFKFYPSWQDGIRAMLASKGTPIVFTEFTLEDQRDNLRLVKSLGDVEVVVEPSRNPFRSSRSVRCSDKSGNYKPFSVIYTNDYICVAKPK